MKAMNAKAMTKGGIAEALSTSTEMNKSVCGQILNSLAEIATQEVKSTGVFTMLASAKKSARVNSLEKNSKFKIVRS